MTMSGPIEQYKRHGNSRPSVERLRRMHDQIQGSDVMSTILIASDICIDLSCADSGRSDHWLGVASDHLRDVVDAGAMLCKEGYGRAYIRALPNLATAYLRQAELSSWARASRGGTIENPYGNLLTAALSVLPLIPEHTGARARVVEFIPLLLGARAMYQDKQRGWMGRLALHREDCRVRNVVGYRTNWDAGISLEATAVDFCQPPIKLQLKGKGGRGRMGEYHRAGVVTISAAEAGFYDTAGILYGCLAEYGIDLPDPSQNSTVQPVGSEELDLITDRIRTRLS